MSTKIEWTKRTWNPLAGCTAKSAGCLNCYAATMSGRLEAMGQEKYAGVSIRKSKRRVFNGLINYDETALTEPLRRRKPDTFFVNSMSDLFWGDDDDLETARRLGVKDPQPVPFEFIDTVFAVMALCPQHIFQCLTKRADRMKAYLSEPERHHLVDEAMCEFDNFHSVNGESPEWPLPNVHLGVSVENQKYADERIPLLLDTPAAVRWISAEPLLGSLNIRRWLKIAWQCSGCGGYFDGGWQPTCRQCGRKEYWTGSHKFNGRKVPPVSRIIPAQEGIGIDWVVIGGESGPGARPCDIAWIRSIVEQCKAAGVLVFVKQLGAKPFAEGVMNWPIASHAPTTVSKFDENRTYASLQDRKGGDPAEWPDDLRVREFPNAADAEV